MHNFNKETFVSNTSDLNLSVLPEQVVSVSVAATEEQPGFTKLGLGLFLPLLLSESQT